MIYFVQASPSQSVKIGYTRDVARRLIYLRTHSHETLNVIRTVDGDLRHEKWWHARFYDNKIRGEWFVSHPDMLTAVCPRQRGKAKRPPEPSGDDRNTKEFDRIIRMIGGTETVISVLNVTAAAVEKWRQNGRVPPKHWATAVEESDGKVKFADLARMGL